MNDDMFGAPLVRDPAVALPDIHIKPRFTPGPVRKQQFVVELVGPRTLAAPSALALLQPNWLAALGKPDVFAMSGSDSRWRPLTASDRSGSFDSLALAWDLTSAEGDLTPSSAKQLWDVAESFAKQVERRAMAMPVPQDIPAIIHALRELRENLDIGINFTLVPLKVPFLEREVWKVAAALGLQYSPEGTFHWLSTGSEEPLLELSPAEVDRFTLAQVKQGHTHPALGLGFWLPRSPDPDAAIEGAFHAGGVLAQRLGGVLMDENFVQVDDRAKGELRAQLMQAVQALTQAGFPPGSSEALKLFSM